MKIVLTSAEVKALMTKAEEISAFFPGKNNMKGTFEGLNISYLDFMTSVHLGSNLTLNINEKDIVFVLDTYGDLFLDSVSPALAIVRNAQRFGKIIETYKPEEKATIEINGHIIGAIEPPVEEPSIIIKKADVDGDEEASTLLDTLLNLLKKNKA
jgi:hypothetical protein